MIVSNVNCLYYLFWYRVFGVVDISMKGYYSYEVYECIDYQYGYYEVGKDRYWV